MFVFNFAANSAKRVQRRLKCFRKHLVQTVLRLSNDSIVLKEAAYRPMKIQKPGRFSTPRNDDNANVVCAVVCNNRRLAVQEVSIVLCHTMFRRKRDIHRVCAKFVPRLLTDD